MNKIYEDKVKLLVRILPYIAKEKIFALKGGSAINLFYKNLPRLSVDIDLSYILFDKRDIAYKNINNSLLNIADNLKIIGIKTMLLGQENKKLICSDNITSIKIEPNYVIRGFIYEPQEKETCEIVSRRFGYAKMKIVSKSELYGGKICAAIDRQHPRDLFDIKEFLDMKELDEDIINGFIIMLLGHDRTFHDLLNPNISDKRDVLEKDFVGMTDKIFTYQDHVETLTKLINIIKSNIKKYKEILLKFVSLDNSWIKKLDIQNIDKLPAIQWKIKNLEKLKQINIKKFEEQYYKLAEIFEQ